MRTPSNKIILDSLEFAARWGFLTRELFFDFICPMSQAQQYRYWNYLMTSGLFVKSRHSTNNLILAKKGRADFGSSARPARSHFYVDHDALVARFFFAFENRGLIASSWLEDEFMRNPVEAYDVLGMPQIQRIPDLVFDLKTANGSTVRCALEIEKVTKSQSRYAKMALAYLNASKIDVILFGCIQPTTERIVQRAFNTAALLESKRIPGTFLLDEFDPGSLETSLKFQSNTMSIKRFVEVVTKQSVPQMRKSREKRDSEFSSEINKKPEAA
tara:strand:- start:28895 stop:29710 length:816 start_codon:yes stop_codon:yes gene_type:complete